MISDLLEYDADTGLFRWKVQRSNACTKGWFPGSKTKVGYYQIRVNNNLIMAHRLAWYLSTGSWPNKFIDHINENKSDNRLSNLREADKSLNQLNQIKANADSLTGHRGVCFDKQSGKFKAQLVVQGKKVLNKLFTNVEEAAKAYLNVKEQYSAVGSRP